MDDPWANAWGDPTNPPATSSWSSHTEEADIGLPAWATATGDQWIEPPTPDASLWNNPASPTPQASIYDGIPLGKTSASVSDFERHDSPLNDQVDSVPTSPQLNSASPPPVSSPSPTNDSSLTPQQELLPTPPSPPQIPGSPDPFGSFETGLNEIEDEPWSSAAPSFPVDSVNSKAWGTPWGSTRSDADEDEGDDEWEAAKRQKEKQDRQVPPELLSSILRQFEELSQDLWPEPGSEGPDKKQDDRDNWRGGMEAVEGLAATVNRLVPQDLSLPPKVTFTQTFVSKNTMEALRLTRNLPMTRRSPMALYVASKGSTAWEASVKARPEAVSDDFSPPGWRVMDKEKEETFPTVDNKRKSSGGLLSFLGRKNAVAAAPTVTMEVRSERASSPSKASSAGTSTSTGSPRVSVDMPKSTPATSTTNSPIASTSASTSGTPIPPPMDLFQSTSSSSTSAILTSSSREATPPPSAVSRFLGRFSRSKSNNSSRNSLALSSDDLEFLSDIVPVMETEVNTSHSGPAQLDALSNMIESSPLPTKLPPPLAPPPRSRPIMPPVLSNPSHSNPPPSKPYSEDFMSLNLFDAPVPKADAPGLSPASPDTSPFASISSRTMSLPPVPKTENSRISIPSHDSAQLPTPFTLSAPPLSISRPPSSASILRPQTMSKRPPITAIMSNTNTSNGGATRSDTQINFPPPPPSSRSHTPRISSPPLPSTIVLDSFTSGALAPTLAGPSAPSIVHPPPPLPSSKASPFDDDDDFSDFHSPPQQSITTSNSTSMYDTSFTSSTSSNQGLFASTSTPSRSHSESMTFDDFDDFVSSPIRTPSPPNLPVKPVALPPPKAPSIPLSFNFKPKSPPPPIPIINTPPPAPPRRKKADHSRTLSLVETAAAKSGKQWPAPPSPLPEAIPPPPAPPHLFAGAFDDTFGGPSLSSMQDQQTKAVAALKMNPSSTSFMLSPSSAVVAAAGNGSDGISRQFSAPPLQSTTLLGPQAPSMSLSSSSGAAKENGKGLSAQDLSFFEGL